MAALTPAAAEGLIASLQRAQAELLLISNRLEEEFSRSCRKGDINMLSVLTRLNKMKRELPVLQEECQAVLQAKQELVDAVKSGLVANTEQLYKLKRRAGIPTDGADDEVYSAFTAAVNEHDARFQVQYAAAHGEIDRDQLNHAYVGSVLA